MPERADAHIHLFEKGFQGATLTSRPGVRTDEPVLYTSLASDHRVARALVVGYEGEAWATGNNAFIAGKARKFSWIAPVAYVDPCQPPSIAAMERLLAQSFVGLSLYVFGSQQSEALQRVPQDVWSWLVDHRWLVSVNSRGGDWSAWRAILERRHDLRVLVSHLGLPPRVARPPTKQEAREAMAEVLALAVYPGVRVKLSGFYALTEPGHGFPHEAAWPYVEVLVESFGTGRLLWGSDFTPCLDSLSFPQTFSLFRQMPYLNGSECQQLEGDNLLTLLGEANCRSSTPGGRQASEHAWE